jgi:hypothetical protein
MDRSGGAGQTCIAHMITSSMRYLSLTTRKRLDARGTPGHSWLTTSVVAGGQLALRVGVWSIPERSAGSAIVPVAQSATEGLEESRPIGGSPGFDSEGGVALPVGDELAVRVLGLFGELALGPPDLTRALVKLQRYPSPHRPLHLRRARPYRRALAARRQFPPTAAFRTPTHNPCQRSQGLPRRVALPEARLSPRSPTYECLSP